MDNLNDKENSNINSVAAASIAAKLIKNNLRPKHYENLSSKIDLSSTKLNKFPLFDKRDDNYIYEKKFFNELPKNLVFPKALSLAPKIENFAKFDMMTMLFGLKKSQEILTNQRLNTNIHEDFINNSIQLIFQEKKINFNKIYNISNTNNNINNNNNTNKKSDEKKLEKIKSDILAIIDSKEETQNLKKELSKKTTDGFYLRNTMLLSSHLNINKRISNTNNNIKNPKNSNVENSNSNTNLEKNKINLKSANEEFGKILEKTFIDSNKIKIGMQHPKKKAIFAKKVYNVLPYFEFDENKFSEIIFPEDPDPDQDNNNNNNNNKFILKKNPEKENLNNNIDSQIFTLFKQEKDDEDQLKKLEEFNSNLNYCEMLKRKVNYFHNEREYSAIFSDKPDDLFNRYLIFMDNRDNTAKILPVFNKIFLKKHRKNNNNEFTGSFFNAKNEDNNKIFNSHKNEDENDNMNLLGKKRLNENNKELIIIPKNLEIEELRNRNQSLANSGFTKLFSLKNEKIVNIEIPKRIIKNNDFINDDMNVDDDNGDDLFGNEFSNEEENTEQDNSIDIENDNYNDNDNENQYRDYEDNNDNSSN
jgi:hypothetical protein